MANSQSGTKVSGLPNDNNKLTVTGVINSDTFISLYRDNLRFVHNYLYVRLGNRQDAEDMTALVFEKAWVSLKNYQPTGSFKAWLFTIANRTLVDHYRQSKVTSVPLEAIVEELLDPATNLEENAINQEQLRQILRSIEGLSKDQKEIFYLRFIADLRYKEIAQVTGKGESAVKMTTHRVIDDIRRQCLDNK